MRTTKEFLEDSAVVCLVCIPLFLIGYIFFGTTGGLVFYSMGIIFGAIMGKIKL